MVLGLIPVENNPGIVFGGHEPNTFAKLPGIFDRFLIETLPSMVFYSPIGCY